MLSEAACLSSAIVYAVKGSRSYSNYRKADNSPDAIYFRQLTERYDKRRNLSLALGAIVWAINLLDMSLSQRKPQNAQMTIEERWAKELHLDLGLNAAGGLQLQFSLNF